MSNQANAVPKAEYLERVFLQVGQERPDSMASFAAIHQSNI